MLRAQGDHMVGARAPDRSDQPFGEAVLPRRARGNGLVADTHGPQSAPHSGTIDPVLIADQVAQLLREKGQAIFSIGPDETVYDALQKMAEANVGCLVVLADGKLVGIVSERDYARNVVLKGRTSPTMSERL